MLILSSCPIAPGEGHAAGRALLRRLYETHTGKPLPAIACSPKGKPYFPEDPLYFSISHTKSHAFCALSDSPIGIDAEELHRSISPRLAEKILSPREYAQYLTTSDKAAALLTFWVLKEALAKCTGEGLRGYPNQTSFSLDDPRVQIMDGCLLAVIQNTMQNSEVFHVI